MDPPIAIEGRHDIPRSRITRDGQARRRYLGPHWGRDDAVLCLCQGKPGIAMGVARRQQPKEVFYLYPLHRGDNARHNRACPHHKPYKEPKQGNAAPTVEDTAGLINVNLAAATYRGETSKGRTPPPARGALNPAGGRLITLLELLWHVAELDTWSPAFAGKRHYGVVQHRINQSAEQFSVKHMALGPRFLMPPPYHPARQRACNQALEGLFDAITTTRAGKTPYGYIVGSLKNWSCDDERGWIALAHLGPKLYAKPEIIAHAVKRWSFAPRTSVVIACVEAVASKRTKGRRPWLSLRDVAALTVSDTQTWIPIDSGDERMLCKRLVAEGRTFDKPLRAGDTRAAPIAGVGPPLDFVLRDGVQPVRMEVLGSVRNPEYAAHACDKRERYACNEVSTWRWDPTQPMPALPATAAAHGE